jgi:hypothetical protein
MALFDECIRKCARKRDTADIVRDGDLSTLGDKLLLDRELEEDRLIASGGIRLEPRDSPKRAVAGKIGKRRDVAALSV